jgi:hypothetical protein
MKTLALLMAGAAFTVMGSTAALADCPPKTGASAETTGAVTGQQDANAISKDGTHAPLEADKNQAGVTESTGGTTTNMTGQGTDTAAATGATPQNDNNATTGAADTAAVTGSTTGTGVSSGATGTTSGAASGSTDMAAGGGVSKDGTTMPLQGAEGQADTQTAMSQQDAEAQQSGSGTAAAQAMGDTECK